MLGSIKPWDQFPILVLSLCWRLRWEAAGPSECWGAHEGDMGLEVWAINPLLCDVHL